MNLSIGNKIALGFALALITLLVIGTTLHKNLAQVEDDTGWVTHTLTVEKQLSELMVDLVQAESASRGYQLAINPAFKAHVQDAENDAQAHLQYVRRLTIDNENQQKRLDRLEPLIRNRFQALNRLTQLRDQTPTSPGQEVSSLVNEGQNSMDQVRGLINEMIQAEETLLTDRQVRAANTSNWTFNTIIWGTTLAFIIVGLAGWAVTRSITNPLRILGDGASKIGKGNYAHRVQVTTKDEVGDLAGLFNRMAAQVEERQRILGDEDWIKTGLTKFSQIFQGQREIAVVCPVVLTELAKLLNARHLVLYIVDRTRQNALTFQAGYAHENPPQSLKAGEGLVGQAYADGQAIVLNEIPEDYLKINSVLGDAKPKQIVVQPALFEGQVKAVIELATFVPLNALQLRFLSQFAENFGVVINTIQATMRTEELLEQTRKSEQLLQVQQEELQQTNEEMEQTNEELQQTNEEMEEKVNLLAEQKRQMERANREIEQAREELENRAQQIAQGSRYKSEFLANMSHELRTPLNSLLILAKMLADNAEANLTAKQTKYAETIYSSGNDLLELINEILDLAKIESGAIEFDPEPLALGELRTFIEQGFGHVADGQKLDLRLDFDSTLPASITTDPRRLQQILKNLLSNAFKFTEHGSVTLKVIPVTEGWKRPFGNLDRADSVIAFEVTDTGVGIPADKHELVFGAFQQADASTARKYGGTGLGLSISRELASLLGGTLELTRSSESGSTFTLYLPAVAGKKTSEARQPVRHESSLGKPQGKAAAEPEPSTPIEVVADPEGIEDDRSRLETGDMVLLIIEDDRNFSELMRDFARDKNFKVVVARVAAQGIALARQLRPSAITLDLHLPDNDGWVVLDRLKHDPITRHIPIHIISVDPERERSLRLGAVSYIQKPVTKVTLDAALDQTIDFINRPLKTLLIIEDDEVQRESLVDLVGNGDVKSTAVGTAEEAMEILEKKHFDCIVLDLGLPDLNGVQLIRDIHTKLGLQAPPIIVYTGKDMSRAEETELRMISDSIVIKSVRSPERLLDETALFLHRIQTKLPEPKQRMIERVQKSDTLLVARKVLIVDDDVRNIFAITSALEAFEMEVKYAESGQAGIDLLQNNPDIEIVLMDVMMPEMDGFETIRRIRRIDRFKKLPIISVTAKAMKDDREKCLQAGASDYITKPVDLDQLRSLLRVWLYR